MIRFVIFCLVIIIPLITGCSSIIKSQKRSIPSPQSKPQETRQDVESALESVVGAVSGQDVSPEELRALGEQIRKDEEAKSSVKAITESFGSPQGAVKYCPVDGERYGSKLEICPVHDVALEEVEE